MSFIRIGNQIINLNQLVHARLIDGYDLRITLTGGTKIRLTELEARKFWDSANDMVVETLPPITGVFARKTATANADEPYELPWHDEDEYEFELDGESYVEFESDEDFDFPMPAPPPFDLPYETRTRIDNEITDDMAAMWDEMEQIEPGKVK